MFSSKPANKEDMGPGGSLKAFVSQNPTTQYTFESERDAALSELCRAVPEGSKAARECIMLKMTSKKLFATMQNLGFYCALPMDPEKTYIECTPLTKEMR